MVCITISGPFVKHMKASGGGEQVGQWLRQGKRSASIDPKNLFLVLGFLPRFTIPLRGQR